MLEQAGYHCVTSTMDPTAVCALHLENRLRPDPAGPADARYGRVGGHGGTEQDRDRRLSVRFWSSRRSRARSSRALQAGAKDFISKPFDRAEVLTRIHNLLEVRLLHAQAKTHGKQMEDEVQVRTAELRQTEEMFRQLATNIPEALWIRDVEQKTIQYVNAAWEKLCGLTRGARRCDRQGLPGDSSRRPEMGHA